MNALTMMGSISRTVLLSLAALGVLSPTPSFADSAPTSQREDARRQLALRDAMQEVQEARLAYSARKYSDAVEHYRNALAVLPKGDATERQRKFIKDSLSDALIAKAIDYRSVGRREEATEFLTEAVELSPDNQRAKVELVYTGDPVRHNPALSPQHLGDVEEVSRLLTLAYGHMDLGRYDEAIATFESVRRYDAYNEAAKRGIEQAQKRRSEYFRSAHDAFRADALADVDATWEERVPDANATDSVVREGSGSGGDVVSGDSELQEAHARGLEEMVLPQIVFDDATIFDVVEALQNQIKRFESNGLRSGRHINITTNFGQPNSAGYKELMGQRIRMNLQEVNVRDVLDFLSNQLDISYYFTPSGVELSYSGKDFGPLIDRTFTVPPHFFDPSRDEEEEDDSDDDSAFEDGTGSVAVRRVNPARVLEGMGVSFPEGASARYAPSSRLLHVRNTAHNLEEIQELLNVPMDGERQVILNVIVMQVEEKDLEELGFDWLVNINLNPEHMLSGGVGMTASTAAGLPVISGVPPTDAPHLSSGLRSGSEVITSSNIERLIEHGSASSFHSSGAAPAPGIFGFRGIWTQADVSVIMRGLSQRKGVDVLQNPRLVFSPGAEEQVTFANVRELYYPESYERGQITTTNIDMGDDEDVQATAASGAFPTDFVRFGMSEDGPGGIGTILQVHEAEVDEHGRFVNLALTTTVTDFEGFINWGSPIQSALWAPAQGMGGVVPGLGASRDIVMIELSPNYILKPVFKRHLTNTKLTVAPGSVLVFAGLKEGKKVRYEDKIPVLGDLPLVGRFFRSEGEENSRKVLLYFAKVDVVDPAGRDVNTGKRPSEIIEGL